MAKNFPFRRRRSRKWTHPRAYGHRPPRRGPRRSRAGNRWRGRLFAVRPFVLLAVFIGVAAIMRDGGAFEPPEFLQTAPQRISGSFTRCGPGRGPNCVIDGDTFKLGEQSVRVVGIDTAEKDARCPAEAAQAVASTAALQAWLNRGPFQMTARIDEPTDRYGRALRIVKRVAPDGSENRLADWMIAEGGARSYYGGWRGGWC